MTAHRSEDLERFAVARWPSLVRTAYLVCGSAAEATRRAADALAALDRDWPAVLGEGAPAARVRALLVRRLLADPPGDATPPLDHPTTPLGEGSVASGASVEAALLGAFAVLPVLTRTALALDYLEGLTPGECAAALDRPEGEVRAGLERAHETLVAVHRRACLDAGAPADLDDPVDADLRAALRNRAEQAGLAGDPLPLLRDAWAARRRRSRVGALVGAGALAVALAVVLTGLASRAAVDGVPGPTASTPAVLPVTDWPARGELADEPVVTRAALAQWDPTTHLLYAGDVGTTRIVVGWRPSGFVGGVRISILFGTAGGNALAPDSDYSDVEAAASATSIVVVGPPGDGKTPLLVLGPPGGAEAEVSSHVSYALDGRVDRIWSTMFTRNGVAFAQLLGTRLPALRVRIAGYDGPPANSATHPSTMVLTTCASCSAERWRTAVARVVTDQLSAASRVPAGRITTTVLATGTVTETVPATPASPSPDPRRVTLDIACLLHRMPDGATVISSSARTPAFGVPLTGTQLSVVPAGSATTRPCVLPPAPATDPTAAGSAPYIVAARASGVRVVPAALDPLTPGGYVDISGGAALVSVPGSLPVDRAVLDLTDRTGRGIETWPLGDLVRVVDPFDLTDTAG